MRGLRGNRHGFVHRAHLQNELSDREALIGGDDDAGALESLEAGMLHFDRVRVGLHGDEAESAGLVGGRFPRFLRALAGESDFGIRYGAGRWVDYRPADASRDCHLREHRAG